jgi:hypothetical protein
MDHSLKCSRSKTWRVERVPGGYAIRDPGGRIVAHVYGQAESSEGFAGQLTMDEAKEMALNIAKAGGAGFIGHGA